MDSTASVPPSSPDHSANASEKDSTNSSELLASTASNAPHATEKTGLQEEQERKRTQIQHACAQGDFDALARLATSRAGLLDDTLRRSAWPILLGCAHGPEARLQRDGTTAWKDLPEHPDEHQVQLDVDRSFVYYPSDRSESQLDERRAELQQLIVQTLRRHPYLCYFQGYHDIVQVLLLVLGLDAAVPAVARLSLLRIRDFMLPTLTGAMTHLHLLFPIINAVDRKLSLHLSRTQPFFALSATLTMYAHEIQGYGDIARLFDFLLANEAALSLYLFATIILNRRSELLAIDPTDPELHSALSSLPHPLDLESLLAQCIQLFEAHPPASLARTKFPKSFNPLSFPLSWATVLYPRPWFLIPASSVLKSTSPVQRVATQTTDDGAALFHALAREMTQRQAAEDRLRRWDRGLRALRADMRKRRRHLFVAGAVLIGAVGWYLGRRAPEAGFPIGTAICDVGRRVSAALRHAIQG